MAWIRDLSTTRPRGFLLPIPPRPTWLSPSQTGSECKISLAKDNRGRTPPAREQAQAEEALGEAVDILAGAFGATTHGDQQRLDAVLVHSIEDEIALAANSKTELVARIRALRPQGCRSAPAGPRLARAGSDLA